MKLTPDIIRVCRVNLGLTQGKLASMSNVSGALIGHIERGERPLTEEVEGKIRKALPLTDDEIMDIVLAHKRLTAKKLPE